MVRRSPGEWRDDRDQAEAGRPLARGEEGSFRHPAQEERGAAPDWTAGHLGGAVPSLVRPGEAVVRRAALPRSAGIQHLRHLPAFGAPGLRATLAGGGRDRAPAWLIADG